MSTSKGIYDGAAMTYLQFHFWFILPALALSLCLSGAEFFRVGPKAYWSMGLMSALAFVYTTPWDSFLIHQGVWWYEESNVIGTLFKIPYEEYMFFFLQTWIVGGVFLWAAKPSRWSVQGMQWLFKGRALVGLFVFFEALFIAGLFYQGTYYFSLIMAWCFPVVFIQMYFGLELLIRRWFVVYGSVMLTSLYLWACDWYAIRDGIWMISKEMTTGLTVFGLPMEEMLFFVMTNVMVCQGVALFLEPDLAKHFQSSASLWKGVRKW